MIKVEIAVSPLSIHDFAELTFIISYVYQLKITT